MFSTFPLYLISRTTGPPAPGDTQGAQFKGVSLVPRTALSPGEPGHLVNKRLSKAPREGTAGSRGVEGGAVAGTPLTWVWAGAGGGPGASRPSNQQPLPGAPGAVSPSSLHRPLGSPAAPAQPHRGLSHLPPRSWLRTCSWVIRAPRVRSEATIPWLWAHPAPGPAPGIPPLLLVLPTRHPPSSPCFLRAKQLPRFGLETTQSPLKN